jgi:structural maintenance of chromosomes protein 6
MKNDQRQMDISLKATNKQIEEYDRQIAEEARRLEADTSAKREETQRKLDEARTAVATAQARSEDASEQKHSLERQCEVLKDEGMQAEREMGAVQGRIRECEGMIERCMQQEKNSLAAYGKDIKGVLERIGKMRWAGDVPLGPLGVGVKVKEPEKWAELLRLQLGGYLTAFAVTDARDRAQLKKLLEQTGK